ncbi:DNA repair protein RecO [Candidatus Peregrinibacteria bacterium CG10_big_fil_rev_8_21_14_0_10_49_24]|nr:MAG: DNA repair protein RecO [Candidatus Peregrinibacteria bacterium CG11_big_fil_rev_8_21_14_0_20_49_14]PIR51503.1 MAG: DNA repair protein RecO [Candidatus Peregrinibacteria bacterium CG10_big_fil_rev_8_21_14_0_10_49_24]PJA67854.1 MAG: DNA repair protein RecO [Candidatus Peregrinibacteria bacterium CG_4_9_14_3_um_filter_49_12]
MSCKHEHSLSTPTDMGHTAEYHSIVLKTYDVGEADRFCIVLTRERGKIAARARGVRKPKSRMGGSILPLQESMLSMHESSSGLSISGVSHMQDHASALSLPTFLHAQQATELLLSVLEDDHPVPDIFELMRQFLTACRTEETVQSLPFTVRILQTMGILPTQNSHQIFTHLSMPERELIETCAQHDWHTAHLPHENSRHLQALCNRILEQQTNWKMKAGSVASSMLLANYGA